MATAPQGPAGSRKLLLLPGWHNSGPGHWQSLWELNYGDQRVIQHDWQWPRRGDWMARLDETIQAAQASDIVLVAHSLGCQLVAAWASHSQHTHRVKAALLVAPADPEREDAAPQLFNWRPVPSSRLPFYSTIVASTDDPFCTPARSRLFAEHWGSTWIDIGPHGHINADSGLGDWQQGRSILDQLIRDAA
jgi:uncharacterized protein